MFASSQHSDVHVYILMWGCPQYLVQLMPVDLQAPELHAQLHAQMRAQQEEEVSC